MKLGLRHWLTADALANRLEAVSLEGLKKRGISGLVIDLDNTLTPWNKNKVAPSVRSWLEKAKRSGFGICIVSNAHRTSRIAAIARDLGIKHVSTAWKPRRSGFRKAMALLNTQPKTTAVIGDQLFTDVLGGKRIGAFTVWVSPISTVEFLTTRFVRKLERLFVRLVRLPNPLSGTTVEGEEEQVRRRRRGEGGG